MSLSFSDVSGNTGILQQTRKLMRVDSTQWPTINVVNSCNNWMDLLTGYAIASDKNFQWDNTTQTKLPEGTTALTINQSDYSFLTDEQGNNIVTLVGVSILLNGYYQPLQLVDRSDASYNPAYFGFVTGTPYQYDKIGDNIIRLNSLPTATVAAGLKFYFQRTSPYYATTDTTKTSGFSPLLDRGFIIASAYDGALTLGLPNLQALSAERQLEEKKVQSYFAERNNDDPKPTMTMKKINFM